MVWKAVKRRAARQMGPEPEVQSEGCTAGGGSCSPDVWYVMKPTVWSEQGYIPGESYEPLSSLIYVLEAHLTVIWEMNLGAIWEGNVQRSLDQGYGNGHEV